MPAPTNILKARLAKGETLFGCWLGMADSYVAGIAATAGFDWLLIDGEHAPNDIRSILAQLQALEAGPSLPIVRLPDDDATRIKQALDIGAQSLLVPMVESGAQAEAIFRATHYPPLGLRGVGLALARASGFSAIPDYLTTADDQICLIVQIESRAGLAALDDILAVDGIDGVFVGPSDLAADMGHPGNPTHPEVKSAVLDALTRIRAADGAQACCRPTMRSSPTAARPVRTSSGLPSTSPPSLPHCGTARSCFGKGRRTTHRIGHIGRTTQ